MKTTFAFLLLLLLAPLVDLQAQDVNLGSDDRLILAALFAKAADHGGTVTIPPGEPLVAGQWHFATLVVDADKATLYLNGKPVGEVKLKTPIAATQAPITLGGIWDSETVCQAFHGAVDEFSFQPRVLSAQEITAAFWPM